MCDVYRAQHIELERTVALKLLHSELATDSRERERFIREARNCATLEHKNIVAIYETGLIDDSPFIAMEYVEGETLEAKLKGKLSLDELLPIVEQICLALEFAHEAGIVHRDLKPANILITKDGVAKVADWGLSKTTKEEANLTRTGMVMGTPQYMAPEQIMRNEASARSDLYSLGVIIFEGVAGRLPFHHEDLVAILQAHIKENAPKLRRLANSCPPWLEKLVVRLLTKDPLNRISSARIVLDNLSQNTRSSEKEGREVYAETKIKWALPLGFAVLLFVVLFALLARPTLEKKISIEKLTIDKITLPSKGALEIRFRGAKQKIALTYSTPSGEVLSYQKPTEVDLGEGNEITKDNFALKVALEPYVTRNIIVTVGKEPLLYRSQILPGTKRVKGKLSPLTSLTGKEFTSFLKDLYFQRDRYRRASDGENESEQKAVLEKVREIFTSYGLTPSFLAQFSEDLPFLIHSKSYLDEPLALLLRPLIMAEAALANKRKLRPHWPPIFKQYGVRYLASPTKSGLNSRLPGFHVIGRLGLTKVTRSSLAEDGFLYSRTFLIEPNAGLATQAIFGIARLNSREMKITDGEAPPSALQIKTVLTGLFPVKRSREFSWPPEKAYLAITSRYLPTDIQLACQLNESDVYYLSNARGYGREGASEQSANTLNLLPIKPKQIKVGPNKVVIKLWSPCPGSFAGTVALSEILVIVPSE